jgi:hypothetical protein
MTVRATLWNRDTRTRPQPPFVGGCEVGFRKGGLTMKQFEIGKLKDVEYRDIKTGEIIKASEFYREWSREIWYEEKAQGLYEDSEIAPPHIHFPEAVSLGCEILDDDEDFERV